MLQFAKKTGDYAVLSHVDLCLLALTYTLHEQSKNTAENVSEEASSVVCIRQIVDLPTDAPLGCSSG